MSSTLTKVALGMMQVLLSQTVGDPAKG